MKRRASTKQPAVSGEASGRILTSKSTTHRKSSLKRTSSSSNLCAHEQVGTRSHLADQSANDTTAPEEQRRGRSTCMVVAIGASAGGLQWFQRFFDQMSAESGMAFVLIQHLDPTHETLLPELLKNHTQMPIDVVAEGIELRPDRIYVSAPNALLGISDGRLRVTRPTAPAADPSDAASAETSLRRTMAIDHFFRSLAEDQQHNVVAIILSGAGTDGTLGLKAIKDYGGLTIAQSPETAKYDSMPRNAILSGLVDHVLSVDQMPARILEYVSHLRALEARKGAATLHQEIVQAFPKIFPLLRRATGHDFSRYKQSTVVRRVQRRMQVLYLDSAAQYLDVLQQDDNELKNLFKDLLIGVTQFFRDPEVFDALARHVIPKIFGHKSDVRVWVPGCATGEEAYSIAILLAEHAARLASVPRIQLFATDLDQRALEMARKGIYGEQNVEQLSPERLERFFLKHATTYEVVPSLREMCVFSVHNLIKDPPFSRQDLISCRNLLIYLEADLQRKLLPVFHYALNPCGFLLLGPAENVAGRSELFRIVDNKQRVFQRKPSILPATAEALHVPVMQPARVTPLAAAIPAPALAGKEQNILRTIERVVLEDYAPASVVINEQGEVVYFSGHTGKFLEPTPGAPSNKIINMAPRSLRLELRTAIHRALTTREEVVRPNLKIKRGSATDLINLTIRPLAELGKEAGLFIVVFQEVPRLRSAREGRSAPSAPEQRLAEVDPVILRQLENELRTTREDLQTTIEELETSNEELKSANEELLSTNEELQSTNEELQTSKEELQSLNDELQRKVEELDAANSDLQNFFQSTQVATLFLGPDLRIKKFTPAIQQLARLTERDIGRHLLDAAPDLAQGEIIADIQSVLSTLTPRERQMPLVGGQRWYMARIMPYRAVDQSIQGAVITFADVTDLKRWQLNRAELAAIVEGSHDAIIGKSLEGTISSWNRGAERIYGYTAAEVIGKPISFLTVPERQADLEQIFAKVKSGERIEAFETVRRAKDGRRLTISLTLSPIFDAQGRIAGISGIDRDISEGKASELYRAELAAIVEGSHDGIIGKTLEGIITSWNRGAQRMYGYTAAEAIGQSISLIVPREKEAEQHDLFEKLKRGEFIDSIETTRVTKDGRRLTIFLTLSPIYDSAGKVIGISGIDRDVTERRVANQELREAQTRLSRYTEELETQVAQRTQVLKETIQSLEGVCYTIAHDLRAPLRTLQGFTRILLDDYAPSFDDQGRILAERIVGAATRMDALIHDLLEFAKLTHLELPLVPLDLNGHVQQVLAQLAGEIEARRADVILQPLPRVYANETVLNQVLTNLIANGLKFIPADTKPRIDIWAETLGANARIFVKDNGIGIDASHHERIFGLFQRLHKPEAYPGTGIGLAIVRKGMERMGGTVGVQSALGQGSCFYIDLRLAND